METPPDSPKVIAVEININEDDESKRDEAPLIQTNYKKKEDKSASLTTSKNESDDDDTVDLNESDHIPSSQSC